MAMLRSDSVLQRVGFSSLFANYYDFVEDKDKDGFDCVKQRHNIIRVCTKQLCVYFQL